MKKIGILTINDNNNYGNRLQNYAVQQVLRKKEFLVETIINTTRINKNMPKWKSLLKNIKFRLKCKTNPRKKYFDRFNKNINFSKVKINYKKIPKNINDKYDYFVTGSDQVWNPKLKHFSAIDFLTFTTKNKKIAFSASIGLDEIDNCEKSVIKKFLKDFDNISVREESAKTIINELLPNKKIEVLLDPTMAVESTEWEKLMVKPDKFDKLIGEKPYILNYFLDGLSEQRKKDIYDFAKKHECKVINILDKNDPFYKTGPSEFLYLEKNAVLICTDSFHSSVFSILFSRPFLVFEREKNFASMNTRLSNLLYKLGLENRIYKNKIEDSILHVEYTNAHKIIEKERKKIIAFIEKSIHNN